MICSDIMKTDVEYVSPQTSVRDAARKMRDLNVGFLPVCDENMHAIGAITDRDIAVRGVADDEPSTARVEHILTPEVVACSPDDDISYALELMALHHKSRIMCINESGRIEGVISLSDIAEADEYEGASALREISSREARGAERGSNWSLSI
ncbi:MAG TPA: CBS domain-containing protein [Steroidobacter sp.]|jgi:CBS domain-containing protein|nr:CBS domain-containing protein [Steroidobacter sp.]